MHPNDAEFVDQFEHLLQQIEEIVRQYPPEMRAALRDEARVALRLQLQQRWEATHDTSGSRVGSEPGRR